MIPMTYKGYAARIEYSDADHCLIGHIAGIRMWWAFTAPPWPRCARVRGCR